MGCALLVTRCGSHTLPAGALQTVLSVCRGAVLFTPEPEPLFLIPWEGTMTGGPSSVRTAHCRHACKFQLETLIRVERQTTITEVTSISAARYSPDKELPLNVSSSSVQMR